MKNSILQNGYPTLEELKQCNMFPSEDRFARGPVAVIECVQEIPCNPCENACKQGSITVGNPITNLPQLNDETCTGCGLCVAQCSGLAIFIVDKTFSETLATVSFPHEYLPLPEKGQVVDAVNRAGDVVCQGTVVRIQNPIKNDCTPVVTLSIPKEWADDVRGMKRLKILEPIKCCTCHDQDASSGKIVICRCEEVTDLDIKNAIAEGAISITGVKRRTRAGMGLCQGRTCQNLVSRLLTEETGLKSSELVPDTARPPVKPVPISVLGGDDDV